MPSNVISSQIDLCVSTMPIKSPTRFSFLLLLLVLLCLLSCPLPASAFFVFNKTWPPSSKIYKAEQRPQIRCNTPEKQGGRPLLLRERHREKAEAGLTPGLRLQASGANVGWRWAVGRGAM